MGLRERDKNIIEDLKKFRVLNRDQLIHLHFSNLKQSVTVCNSVMKRLRRDGHIEADTSCNPYRYFPAPNTIKKDSIKIPHFKAIADFYIDVCKIAKPSTFEVEWKTGEKGSIEPDIFMIWNGAPFFVEIQRSLFTKKAINEKYERYAKFYYSETWKEETWQPSNKKYFPYVWLLTDHIYTLPTSPVRVFQTKTIDDFLKIMKRK